jgi:hypothetical protein
MEAAVQTTYLAPGQRYVPRDKSGWRSDRQLTILLVGRDPQGLMCVTFHSATGQQVVEPAAQFEEAVAGGQFVPVVGTGCLGRC